MTEPLYRLYRPLGHDDLYGIVCRSTSQWIRVDWVPTYNYFDFRVKSTIHAGAVPTRPPWLFW